MASRTGAGAGARASSSKSASFQSSGPSSSVSPRPASSSKTDPILRNALRYTISAREYSLLHKYVISRSRTLKRRAPSVDTVQRIMDGDNGKKPRNRAQSLSKDGEKGKGKKKETRKDGDRDMRVIKAPADDYNARAIRHSIRVFLATGAVMKLWGIVAARLAARSGKKQDTKNAPKQPLHKSNTLRLSLSLSTILLLYRLLFRFLTRLRAHLLDPSAAPFRIRNPKTATALTSPYAPAVGAGLAGLALGAYPSQQMRVTIAIFMLFRALEFGWNCAEDNGMVWGWEKGVNGRPDRKRARPWWWGSWMLQPLAFGQLLHACVFDRDCFPKGAGDFVFKNSTAYLHTKPEDFPLSLPWPKVYDIVDSLGQMARLNWPAFVSPTLFPNKDDTLPVGLNAIAPLTSGAHPLITSLSCATLHPTDPSCSRTFLTFWLRSFPPLTRMLLVVYSAMMLPKSYKAFYHFPLSTMQKLVSSALRTSAFFTGAMATAWSSICFFQAWFPRTFLPTQRFFLGGFLAGMWAMIFERRKGRGLFIYSAKMSLDSFWKVGVKRRWWKAMKGGDVWVFVLALMLTGIVYERDAKAVKEGAWRKGISWVRGEGFRDWAAVDEELEDEEVDDGVMDEREELRVYDDETESR